MTFLTENGALDFLINERIREVAKNESKNKQFSGISKSLNNKSSLSKSQIEEKVKDKSTKKGKNRRKINKKRPKTAIEKRRKDNIFANLNLTKKQKNPFDLNN